MFLPIMFTSHTHLNGAIVLSPATTPAATTNADYEKSLLEAYMPYLTFFDWLCRNSFSRRTPQTTNTKSAAPTTSSTAADSASLQLVLNSQSTKQLIDLILYTSQQFVLLNISFIAYLSNYLENSNTGISSARVASPTNSAGANQATLNNSEFFGLLVDSPYLYSYINTILTDFRYLLSKKEIYEFFQLVLQRFILNIVSAESSLATANAVNTSADKNAEKPSSSSSKSSSTPSITAASPSPVLLTIKTFVERCCLSVNEIRFYFEFQQLSKHLLAALGSSLKKSESNLSKKKTIFRISAKILIPQRIKFRIPPFSDLLFIGFA